MGKRMSEVEAVARAVPGPLAERAGELMGHALFMAEKLDGIREAMRDMPPVIDYDNGGGQAGIRANPVFTEYERLLASYMGALRLLQGMLPENGAEAETTALDDLRARFKVVS